MKPVECEFESEALAAALQSRWDDRLRAHVSTCEICSEAAAVAIAMFHAREEMRASAAIPDSGRVWWLARLRARREAAQAAGRPILAAQVIAFACAVGLLGAWIPSAARLLLEHGAIAAAMAVVLFLVPAAAYLALGRD